MSSAHQIVDWILREAAVAPTGAPVAPPRPTTRPTIAPPKPRPGTRPWNPSIRPGVAPRPKARRPEEQSFAEANASISVPPPPEEDEMAKTPEPTPLPMSPKQSMLARHRQGMGKGGLQYGGNNMTAALGKTQAELNDPQERAIEKAHRSQTLGRYAY